MRLNRILASLCLLLFVSHACIAAFACCSMAPAHFEDTYGWIGELQRDGKLVHILAYENVASNATEGGNAMILPIPAKSQTLSDKNLLNGEDFRGVVKSLYKSSRGPIEQFIDKIRDQLENLSSYADSATKGATVQVFEKGSYTVVLSDTATAIPGALSRVPEEKRPKINKEIFEAYDKWYPGWSFAMCCFKTDLKSPEPLIWWYEPRNPDRLFFPAVDAHTGKAPVLDSVVKVDHKLVVSSDKMSSMLADTLISPVHKVKLERPRSEYTEIAQQFIPNFVMGNEFEFDMVQGDFLFQSSDVRSGILRPIRANPEGSPPPDFSYSAAEFLERDYSVPIKVFLIYVLTGVLLFVTGSFLMGVGMLLFSWLAMYAIVNAHIPIVDVPSLYYQGLLTNGIAFAALLLPALWFCRKAPKICLIGVLGTFVAAGLNVALPGYSSSWLVLLFSVFLVVLRMSSKGMERDIPAKDTSAKDVGAKD